MQFTNLLFITIAVLGATAAAHPGHGGQREAAIHDSVSHEKRGSGSSGSDKKNKKKHGKSAGSCSADEDNLKNHSNENCSADSCNNDGDCDQGLGCTCQMGWCRD
ncbi:hypothetical protein GLAREA_11414 [Glarea lozoyensis ATCC 20868]|uniref:Uncharacterized protein n=1 Tax=Glarea lozoyensis (strain ATCC 20868 / MF5171) TaxID=1116229 RepID=S3DDX3_GLAL2|nr:uncharacterized protein GLAREA_11414 [Glarea lozoyensis ATCC 20868]EPE24833.1 hypothetical protein GLAREA_11414 [Glarea lozoyensis ATCC 20868]